MISIRTIKIFALLLLVVNVPIESQAFFNCGKGLHRLLGKGEVAPPTTDLFVDPFAFLKQKGIVPEQLTFEISETGNKQDDDLKAIHLYVYYRGKYKFWIQLLKFGVETPGVIRASIFRGGGFQTVQGKGVVSVAFIVAARFAYQKYRLQVVSDYRYQSERAQFNMLSDDGEKFMKRFADLGLAEKLPIMINNESTYYYAIKKETLESTLFESFDQFKLETK